MLQFLMRLGGELAGGAGVYYQVTCPEFLVSVFEPIGNINIVMHWPAFGIFNEPAGGQIFTDEVSRELQEDYGTNLSTPFIIQVPPFKVVQVKMMLNDNVFLGNVTVAATFTGTEAREEKDVASIAK